MSKLSHVFHDLDASGGQSYPKQLLLCYLQEVVKNFDRLNKLKFSTVVPTAFTERGLYMLATILKGERAENTTLAIVPTLQ